jgi:long-chain acyl-CoA synthetase
MRLAAAALALTLASTALAREVAGVAVPETAALGGTALQLNGAGLRSKLFVKVYVGALYLEQKSSDAAAIVAADAPWLVTMAFKRGVEKEKIVGAFKEGFENNSKADLAALLPGLARVDAGLKDFKEGDLFTISYQPGVGATVSPPGGAAPVIVEGRAFGAALLRNWLGEKPADGDLKKGMLGK